MGGGGGGHSSAAELWAFYRWKEKRRLHLHGVIFGCLIYFWPRRHVGHSVWGKERDEGGGSSYSKPGVVGEGGAAFQRGMMEVFVIEWADEMSRVGTDRATDEGQTGADGSGREVRTGGGGGGRDSRGVIMTK